MPTCPHCGQPLASMRLGVRLPAVVKSVLFDAVKAAGDIGISRDELLDQVYADRKRPTPATIKAHVQQINDLLLETDFQIRADRGRFTDGAPRFYLVRRCA
jgi:hypothetical protein